MAACALGLVAACHLDAQRRVTLQLGTVGTCVRTSLACGGEIGLVVTDGKTNEVLDTRCIPFAADAGMTLDKLPSALVDVMPPLPAFAPGRSIVVEVAAYSPATGKGCPRYLPDVGGNPAVPSYFGKSAASTVGVGTSIAVSLQCFPTTCLPCAKLAAPSPVLPVDDAGVDGGALDGKPEDGRADDASATDAKLDAAKTDAVATGATGDGSAGAPYHSINQLLAALSAGQVGCLTEGTYVEDVTFPKGGSNANPITLASAPGAHAVIKGVVTVPDTADYVSIVNLALEGDAATPPKSPSPLVRGDHVALRGDDISNAGLDCVTLGDPMFGVAKLTVVEDNRIHGCKAGVAGRLAESAAVAHNVIFDNTGDGVAFFPNGDSFTVEHNVIDGNASGVLFGSDGRTISINDVVRLNIISNATKGFDVYSAYPTTAGTGNSATQNCLWMGAKGEVATPLKGFSVKDNIIVNPLFVDRAGKDFRLAGGSPCAAMGPLR